jgi:hypothetical protein
MIGLESSMKVCSEPIEIKKAINFMGWRSKDKVDD